MQINTERGTGLFGFAVVLAIVASIAAYAILVIAMSQARQGHVLQEHPRARYAAEAGLVLLRERLLRNPAYCTSSSELTDTNGDGGGDTWINLQVTNCGVTNRHQLISRVAY